MKRILTLSLGMLLCTTVALAKDIKTLVVTTTPQMHCENCEKKIKNNVRFVKGVKAIETNLEKQTVSIKYDADKTSVETLVEAFKKIGFSVREVKPGEVVVRHEGEKCGNM